MLLKGGTIMVRRRVIAALLVLSGFGIGGALTPPDARAAAQLSALSNALVAANAPAPAADSSAEEVLEVDREALRVRFQNARSLVEEKAFREAAEAFERLALEDALLADTCWYHAGASWLEAKEPELARTALAHVSQASARWIDARLLEAEAAKRQGAWADAADALAPLWDPAHEVPSGTRALALHRAAAFAHEDGNKDLADALRLQLWALHPTSKLASRAARDLGRKGLTPLAKAQRADALANLHQHVSARRLLREVKRAVALPDAAACLAQFVEGKILRKERRHTDAVRTLSPVVERCDGEELRPRALYMLATSEGILDPATGRDRWLQLAREYPAHSFADDALFTAAEAAVRLGQTQKALEELDTLVLTHPEGDFAGEAWFRRFFIRWRAGDEAQALTAVNQFEVATRQPHLFAHRARALYWQGRVHVGEKPEVTSRAWAELLAVHPTTLYAAWAKQRLGDDARELPSLHDGQMHADALPEDPAWQVAVELHLAGDDGAQAAFARVPYESLPPDARVAAWRFFMEEGLGKAAASLSERDLAAALQGPLDRDTRPVWERFRPSRYEDLLETAAARAGVEVDLLRGLVLRESRFNAKARSGAGAIGLAQLMPPTARQEMKALGLTFRGKTQLYDPGLNARLGAGYLAKLLRQFDGRAELALAAYNGGPGRVSRWWRERETDELDVFVESIPLDETREYVKKVMEGYIAYQSLRRSAVVAAAPGANPTEG